MVIVSLVSYLQDRSRGDILLSITYHPEAGTLEVLIWEACNLKKQDLIGLPSKYNVQFHEKQAACSRCL